MPLCLSLLSATVVSLLDISELGRTSRMYSELSQRTDPTISDVRQALVDAGQTWGWG